MPVSRGWPQFPGCRGSGAPASRSSLPPPRTAPQQQGGEPSGALAGGGVSRGLKDLMPRGASSAPEPCSCPRRHQVPTRPEAAAPGSLSGRLASAQISPELLLCSSPGRRFHPHGNF
ncbi:hypothetical protein NDU88_001001 [Pleurodeles waltl]|uniref:Uncharacterized protein n=1 Tax=Pleurodeles waltl TaxID=8319 RepID=A0AAV7UU33_PLEWA|nr:hypothetical protein NDU88_001001 [Pleurodeles waltl]